MEHSSIFKGQRGGALVWVAIGIIPLIGMLGLVIDYGEAAVCANKMQKAVDAAALAGASFLPDELNAEIAAGGLADSNYTKYDGCDVAINGDEITVTMKRVVPTRFMRIFGKDSVDVVTDATAVRSLPVEKINGHIMPFCKLNPNTNYDPADDLVEANWGKSYILFYGEDSCIVQDWADGDGESPLNGDWEGGQLDNNGNQSPFEGWRGGLDFATDGTLDGAGASSFMDNFVNDWPGTTEVDDVLPIETGDMSQNTAVARAERLLGEEDDLFSNFDQRLDYSKGRVVFVPIVSLLHIGSDFERITIDDYFNNVPHDEDSVIIDGFAPFWILTAEEQGNFDGDNNPNNDGDWVVGRFIPGTRMPNSNSGGIDYGALTPPRLID